jgi:ribosome-binding factor A
MSNDIVVRPYDPDRDYAWVLLLYKNASLFWWQYDDARDSKEKLTHLSAQNKEKILVAESEKTIVGTVTLFEDGRTARLYRFAVEKSEHESDIVEALHAQAKTILKNLWHTQVLVYAPEGDLHFEERYLQIGFNKGNNYTAYRQDL